MNKAGIAYPMLMAALVGCSSGGGAKSDDAEFELVKEPFITAEIKTQASVSDLLGSRLNTAGEFTFTLYENESLRSALARFAQAHGYERVVVDLPSNQPDPGRIKTRSSFVVSATSLNALSDKLADELGLPYDNFNLYRVADGSAFSLAVTSMAYNKGHKLAIFDAMPGSLSENAQRLAHQYGWSLADDAWNLSVDYRIKYGYPLLTDSIEGGMRRLFKRYPVQAQLLQSRKEVIFSKRAQPVNQ